MSGDIENSSPAKRETRPLRAVGGQASEQTPWQKAGTAELPSLEPNVGDLPFWPFTSTLRDVLRKTYIKNVTIWLLGKEEHSILAQAGNSVWESALSLIFLAEASEIFEDCNEESELCKSIPFKFEVVTKWLLTRKLSVPGSDYVCWENVTWDTSVVVRSLMLALKKYSSRFNAEDLADIEEAIVEGTNWLYHRFSRWEKEVKYPFGPADVAQIVIAILNLSRDFPALYQRVCNANHKATGPTQDVAGEIVECTIVLVSVTMSA